MRSVGAALVKLIATATSGLVSFTTNVIRPVKVTCEFSPVQEGTGDPSPDNVRPISGWTGCEIHHASNNILGPKGSDRLYPTFIPKGVTVNASHKSTANNTIRYYRKDKTQVAAYFIQGISDAEGYKSRSYTATEDIYWVKFDSDTEDQQLNFGSTRLPYNEPQAATLPITFTDPTTGDPMTVYGGTVTLNEDGSVDLVARQALWVEDGRRQPANAVWHTSGEGDLYNRTLFGRLPRPQHDYIGEYTKYFSSDNRKFMSNINSSEWKNKFCFAAYRAAGYSFAYSIPKNLSTKAEVAAYFAENPTTVVYPLETPLTYHFDNIGQLQSFLGTNNIWHNMNGDITVEYWNKQ